MKNFKKMIEQLSLDIENCNRRARYTPKGAEKNLKAAELYIEIKACVNVAKNMNEVTWAMEILNQPN